MRAHGHCVPNRTSGLAGKPFFPLLPPELILGIVDRITEFLASLQLSYIGVRIQPDIFNEISDEVNLFSIKVGGHDGQVAGGLQILILGCYVVCRFFCHPRDCRSNHSIPTTTRNVLAMCVRNHIVALRR